MAQTLYGHCIDGGIKHGLGLLSNIHSNMCIVIIGNPRLYTYVISSRRNRPWVSDDDVL